MNNCVDSAQNRLLESPYECGIESLASISQRVIPLYILRERERESARKNAWDRECVREYTRESVRVCESAWESERVKKRVSERVRVSEWERVGERECVSFKNIFINFGSEFIIPNKKHQLKRTSFLNCTFTRVHSFGFFFFCVATKNNLFMLHLFIRITQFFYVALQIKSKALRSGERVCHGVRICQHKFILVLRNPP